MACMGEYEQGHVSVGGLAKVTKEGKTECWLASDSCRAMAQNASNSGLEVNWELTGGLRVIQKIWRLKYIELDALLPSRLGAPEPMVLDLFVQTDKLKAYKSIQCFEQWVICFNAYMTSRYPNRMAKTCHDCMTSSAQYYRWPLAIFWAFNWSDFCSLSWLSQQHEDSDD